MFPGMFNRTILKFALSKDHTKYLSEKCLTVPTLKDQFSRMLVEIVERDGAEGSLLISAIRRSVKLLDELDYNLDGTLSHEAQRAKNRAILCGSVFDRLNLKEAIDYMHLSITGQEEQELPIHGVLTMAAALGDIALIKTAVSDIPDGIQSSVFFPTPLCTAAKYGHQDAISVLLGEGQPDADTLMEACRAGHRHIIETYLTSESYSKYALWQMDGILFAAVGSGNFSLVQYIVELHPIIQQPDLFQDAFFAAVKHHSLGIVEELIESDIDLNQWQENESALGMAAAKGELPVVKLLLANGFHKSNLLSNDSLIQAAMGGHDHVLAYLLDQGFDINARRKRLYGNRTMAGDRCVTPLFTAAVRGELHTVHFLLSRGAQIDPKDGTQALGVACIRGDECLRHFLLNMGLDGSRCTLTDRKWSHNCLVDRVHRRARP